MFFFHFRQPCIGAMWSSELRHQCCRGAGGGGPMEGGNERGGPMAVLIIMGGGPPIVELAPETEPALRGGGKTIRRKDYLGLTEAFSILKTSNKKRKPFF